MIESINSEKIQELRNKLITRNLYTPDNPYSINNSGLVKTINNISDVLLPFSSPTMIGEIFERYVDNRTPLTDIGLKMLSKQFYYNLQSNTQQKVSALISDGIKIGGDKLLSFVGVETKDDNIRGFGYSDKITVNNTNIYTQIGNVAQDLLGTNFRSISSPFTPSSTVKDFIQNSGKGQLVYMISNLNNNIYKPSSSDFNAGLKSRKMYNKLKQQSITISSKVWFETADSGSEVDLYNYNNLTRNFGANIKTELANTSMYLSYVSKIDKNQEYGNKDKIDIGNGYSPKFNPRYETANNSNNKTTYIDRYSKNNGFMPDSENIIWGSGTNESEKYGIYRGIIKYTQELNNATNNSIVDQTKKYFCNGNNIGFNGSPYVMPPENSLFNPIDDYGLRQHTMCSQYNTYAKAIRFDGNKVYCGNPNSTIYNTVIPKFAPNIESGNTCLMFSIENLAHQVTTPKEGTNSVYQYFVCDNGNNSYPVPATEVGPNGGRLMWFMPYDIKFNEATTSNIEAIPMIGRSEPIYTYNSTERTGNLDFKLIIDYPPQLMNLPYGGGDAYQLINEFFEFGKKVNPNNESDLNELKRLKKITEISIKEAKTKKIFIEPPKESDSIKFYFPNDIPITSSSSSISGIIDNNSTDIYAGYEINKNIGGDNYKLNISFVDSLNSLFEKYENYFKDKELRKLLQITIYGCSTQLYLIKNKKYTYNTALALRRAESLMSYVNEKFASKYTGFPTFQDAGISIKYDSTTDYKSTNPMYADSATTWTFGARNERYARIIIGPNPNAGNSIVSVPINESELTIDQRTFIENETIKLNGINKRIDEMLNAITGKNQYFNQFKKTDLIGNYADNIKNRKIMPVFHSQTPDDFLKRLIFLQQCMRQGPSIHTVDNGSVYGAKNSVFGRAPVCILRIADFIHTRIMINTLNITYDNGTWDLNPEGTGMQPMIANVTMSIKIIGGQSLEMPISQLQNAITQNYYANSTFNENRNDYYKSAYDSMLRQKNISAGSTTKNSENNITNSKPK